MSRFVVLSLLLAAAPFTLAHPHHDHQVRHAHSSHHVYEARTPVHERWYQPPDHPVHKLFRRGDIPTDGVTYPTVGSAAWLKAYPPGVADVTKLPKEWTDALNAAVAAGKIPNIPPTTMVNGNPTYPKGYDAGSKQVCSSTDQCRDAGDVWDAPDGVLGTGFDDGPLAPSAKLYDFLNSQNQTATHFMIGTNILQYPTEFTQAFQFGDIAVHTWTHPYMTTLSNLQVVAELGWTMELIHNSTGGRVTRWWRPPYGDSDMRVRAIARNIFGMEQIDWNQDTNDWAIGEAGGPTRPQVDANLKKWITGPKSPGLIILEHELTDDTVGAFIQAYPLMKANGWNIVSQARLNGASAYQNANGTDVVGQKDILSGSPMSATTSSAAAGATAAGNATSTATKTSSTSGATSTWQSASLLLSAAALLLSLS